MENNTFMALVDRAVRSLPQEFLDKLDNIEIMVAEYPTPAQLRRQKLSPEYTLLGLYEGVPQTKRTSGYTMAMPDKITIFQRPIEAECRSDAEIITAIERVVRHEIAHHFGIDDDRLREIGKY
jgi:predicted Zn-dependent protease with MMP-like domain